VAIGIIATPGHAAQTVADQMVEAGIASILNFSPSVINVPETVAVRRVDLAVELQILSFYQHHRDDELASASPFPVPVSPVVSGAAVHGE
jgi:redox-sensing transcriptional repressor